MSEQRQGSLWIFPLHNFLYKCSFLFPLFLWLWYLEEAVATCLPGRNFRLSLSPEEKGPPSGRQPPWRNWNNNDSSNTGMLLSWKPHMYPGLIQSSIILWMLLLLLWASCVWFFVTPRTVARQAPLSMEFSRQEYWSGLRFPSPGDLPNPGTECGFPTLLHWQVILYHWTTWEALILWIASVISRKQWLG